MEPLLAQADVPAPARPPETTATEGGPPAGGIDVGTVVAISILALLVLLMVAAALRLRSRKKREAAAPELPPPPARVQLPETEVDRAEAEARRKAEYDERKREEREARARRQAEIAALPPEERRKAEQEEARRRKEEEEERRRLRREEEERRKAEYRARKEAEREEKERRAREAAEAEEARLRALEEERLRKEEEARLAEEARRKKVEAEAGKTLVEGLSRTREGGFMARLSGLFGSKAEVSETTIGELEEILFTADIGVKTSMRLVEHAQERLARKELGNADRLKDTIRSDIESILEEASKGAKAADPAIGLPISDQKPHVIMVVGVNGAGKTTTIGKLSAKLKAEGRSVLLAAGDTYRAAATEQLDVWAERAEVPIVKGEEGSDPASVIFEAVQRGVREGVDVVIADTAGRLHTRAPLMEELKKSKRVVDKARAGAPDEVLLVLDATMGQNAIQQARQFHEALGVTGIVLTKLDGTAKGGVVIGISDELKIPVRLIGIGESIADLRPFDPKEFVDALFAVGREA